MRSFSSGRVAVRSWSPTPCQLVLIVSAVGERAPISWVVVAHSVPGRRRVLCFYCSLKLCVKCKCVGHASALRSSCTWCLQPLQAPRWLVSIIDRALIDPAIPTQSCRQTILPEAQRGTAAKAPCVQTGKSHKLFESRYRPTPGPRRRAPSP